jgi:hypothetical protein
MVKSERFRSIRRSALRAAAILIFVFVLLPLAPGCDRESTVKPRNHMKPSASLVGHSGCKGPAELAPSGAASVPRDCAEFELLAGDTLILRHVNAAFNCCPGEIAAEISFEGDTITIAEHEAESGCRCLCLYDLDYRITGIGPGGYTIRFVEPYTTDEDEPLRFTVDLASNPAGSFCVERLGYPWSSSDQAGPYGVLISRTGCHSHPSAAPVEGEHETPGDMSCVDWEYSAGGILSLKHVNAAFNCCPGRITADVSVSNDTVTIVEREEQSICDCSCLYDLDFEIRNLVPAGVRTIRIVEPYARPGDERLDFTVDLTALPSGVTCVYRGHYPWTYQSTMRDDEAALEAMRKAIVSLIGIPACGGGGDCRSIGLGAKPCGGVWEYLVYSAAAVDQAALEHLVMFYNAFNDGYNHRYDVVSDCMYVTPPTVGCVEGICDEVDAAP